MGCRDHNPYRHPRIKPSQAHLGRYCADDIIVAELIRPAQPVAPAVVFPSSKHWHIISQIFPS